ncbi:MAG: hypothetical protein CVU46_11775 [Chloroflexi bacterium HGW-Chloroflexi-8]|nr:MAG: hypothetical protein CVU46_11775 [Chloroflexi bacterium HGW-Chloroflexi-8]
MTEQISLVEIVDRINEIEQQGELLTVDQKVKTKLALKRFFLGVPNYLGFYIPEYDLEKGGQLFTGERLHTRMGIHTVLSLEVCRAILSLTGFQDDLKPMMDEIDDRLKYECYVKDYCVLGECAYAALAFWRYLLVSDWPDREVRVLNYVRTLRQNRDGSGGWKHFPFYFTLFVLQETQLPEAREELAYALPACQTHLPNLVIREPFRTRRKMILNYCVSLLPKARVDAWSLGI